ncbi:DUF397 domain-containing protein [Actinomadura craniellae]|uniref:DUF397 domain-containing protein n=1 Tax=Actinomadura craniellae TaxID=2231787 RepID=A0A365GVS4_9ACTN|nr:DUF397 domain-containing protein [Actinomadura craniellae]RAY10875.1 DUF397 domain-containing protein [Actinomadura craniellae]
MNRSALVAGAAWRRSRRSQGQTQNCVELARIGEVVGVRDSKDPDGPHLTFTPSTLRVFAAQLCAGHHDLQVSV